MSAPATSDTAPAPAIGALQLNAEQHRLIVTPGPDPKVEMASNRDLLSNKVGRAISSLLKSGGPAAQIDALEAIARRASELQRIAESWRLDPAASLHRVPQFTELMQAIELYAQVYGANDIDMMNAAQAATGMPPTPDRLNTLEQAALASGAGTLPSLESAMRVGVAASGKKINVSIRPSPGLDAVEAAALANGFARYEKIRARISDAGDVEILRGERLLQPGDHPRHADIKSEAMRNYAQVRAGTWMCPIGLDYTPSGHYRRDDGHTNDPENPHPYPHVHLYNFQGGQVIVAG